LVYECLRSLGIRQRGLYCTKDTFVTTALSADVKIAWLETQTVVSYATLRQHKRRDDLMGQLRREFKHQLRGFPREVKYQLGGFGREAAHQLGSGWGEEFARQLFGPPRRRRQ
jgi:hypothetical protein